MPKYGNIEYKWNGIGKAVKMKQKLVRNVTNDTFSFHNDNCKLICIVSFLFQTQNLIYKRSPKILINMMTMNHAVPTYSESMTAHPVF